MRPRDRLKIQKNLRYLMQSIDVNTIGKHLYERQILTADDLEVLQKKHTIRSHKVEILLVYILPRRGENAYQEFIDALNRTEMHSDIVDRLETTLVTTADLTGANFYTTVEFDKDVEHTYTQLKTLRKKIEDAFDVTLEAHKVKNPDGLEVGRYWLKFSKGQILLISSAEYKTMNDLDACKPIASWKRVIVFSNAHPAGRGHGLAGLHSSDWPICFLLI